jgi:hypothetical protein
VAQVNDLSRSLTAFDLISTLVAVVEISKVSWLVSGAVPRVERQPLKKLKPDATRRIDAIGGHVGIPTGLLIRCPRPRTCPVRSMELCRSFLTYCKVAIASIVRGGF